MNSRKFSDAMSELDNKYVNEALNYNRPGKVQKPGRTKWYAMAACLAIIVAIGGLLTHFSSGMSVRVYAHGTDEEITGAGAVISTGTISDTGEMKGHPLMFYLSGENIETVRFSCKNQQINFTDWTEKRDEYGNAQNFTVTYGEDEKEYYYLTIDWVPAMTIRELTENAEATISTLPEELREDIIVMEITFANGKTATKVVTVSLLEDGTFSASFDNYRISQADDFIKRTDSAAIPRDILYTQTDSPNSGETTGSGEPLRGGSTTNMPQAGNDISDNAETAQPAAYDTDDPNISNRVNMGEEHSLDMAGKAVQDYYADTVFEVVSMDVIEQTPEEISFSVCVSKGGVVQQPNRTIFLQLVDGSWEVVNEGY